MQIRIRTLQIKSRTMSVMTGCSGSIVQCQVMAMLLGATAESDAACMKVPCLFERLPAAPGASQGHCNSKSCHFHSVIKPEIALAGHMSECRMVIT